MRHQPRACWRVQGVAGRHLSYRRKTGIPPARRFEYAPAGGDPPRSCYAATRPRYAGRQKLQQPEFNLRKNNLPAVAPDAPGDEIDPQQIGYHAWHQSVPDKLPGQHIPQPRRQLFETERLGDTVVNASIQSMDGILGTRTWQQTEYRDRSNASDLPDERRVLARQQVSRHHDDVGRQRSHHCLCMLWFREAGDIVTLVRESAPQVPVNRRIPVYNQQLAPYGLHANPWGSQTRSDAVVRPPHAAGRASEREHRIDADRDSVIVALCVERVVVGERMIPAHFRADQQSGDRRRQRGFPGNAERQRAIGGV